MELNTLSLGVFTRLAGVIFGKALDMVEKNARSSGIFVVENIPDNSGETRDYTEIDLELYADSKPQGNQAGRARVQLGYNKLISVKRFAKDIGITYEMRRFNKYPDVVRRLTNLAQMPINRLELDLSHRLGFGTATTYTNKDGEVIDISLGDTLALWSTAHTLAGTSTTYRNRLAGNPQLSKGALEGMERLITEETVNNFGEKVSVRFDIVWTTDDPVTCNTILEYLNSVAAPDFANSGVTNVYKAKYKHVKLPLVTTTAAGLVDNTKRRFWGISSSMISDAHLAVWEEPHLKAPSDLNAGEEFSTDDWNFGVRAGYGIGIVTGRAHKFSSGDATA
jgi:hypothetical protein